jgi:GNAT superfamily N-acetyltransferase
MAGNVVIGSRRTARQWGRSGTAISPSERHRTSASNVAWQRFHDPDEPMFLLGAYVDGKLTGIVQYLFHRSSWTPGNYCYLQDLFVAESARGLGVGRALIEAVYQKAKAAGASRVHWLTQTTNTQARILYDQVADDSGFMQYRKVF